MHSHCKEIAVMTWDKSVPSVFPAAPEQPEDGGLLKTCFSAKLAAWASWLLLTSAQYKW